ncbi:MAG: hypothetical protein EOO28_09390 [Comamonadaceae bacterium]|nr:MAG: hypothetical protein EOO28_09390 [Comamonadaceae bacterium]
MLTINNKQYTVSVSNGGRLEPLTTSQAQLNLAPLPLPADPGMTQSFFQFNILDQGSPIHEYHVFVAASQERCALFDITPGYMTKPSAGRVMEIYSMMAQPELQVIPVRSEPQKICASDSGQLMFTLAPPGPDAFQLKVGTYRSDGKISQMFDFFIPRYFNWVPK